MDRNTDPARSNDSLRENAPRPQPEPTIRDPFDLIAGLAHECRNALQRSQACLELLALKVEKWPDIADLVADVQNAQDHLLRLYEEVRIYAAPVKLRLERHDLGRLLSETWNALEQLRRGRRADLIQATPTPNLQCSVDAQAMSQVLRNILANSLEACADPIEIRASWDEDVLNGRPALRLTLSDNGPGVTAENRRRIFEPFFSTKMRGTGLGLAIARRLVEAHGGVIEAGAGHGQGLEMVIALPRQGSC